MWPKELAHRFGAVYTFEPDHDNFHCLAANLAECRNVVKFQAALGERQALTDMRRPVGNIGANWLEGDGILPTMRLDDLALPVVDFLQLDIEGMEHAAITGALDTLRRCKPVVMVEDKGLSLKFGQPEGAVIGLLQANGYIVKDRLNRDIVLAHSGVYQGR